MQTRFGASVRARRMQLDLTQEQLAARCPLHRNTIGKIERDADTPNDVDRGVLVLLARGLNLSLEELLTGNDIPDEPQLASAEAFVQSKGLRPTPPPERPPPPPSGTPVLGSVTAGGLVESHAVDHNIWQQQFADDIERLPITLPDAFALRVDGDSMNPPYENGDYLLLTLIDKYDLRDGEDAVIQLDGATDSTSTFKQVHFVGAGRLLLKSRNPRYTPKTVSIDSVIRVGRVAGIWRVQ